MSLATSRTVYHRLKTIVIGYVPRVIGERKVKDTQSRVRTSMTLIRAIIRKFWVGDIRRTTQDFLVGRCLVVSCDVRWALCRTNAHRTLHDTTRHDTTRQPPTRKSCNVRGSTTRHNTTRQKSGLVVSDLTMLDICVKARFLSCCVASCRRPSHITRFSCRELSCRGGHKMTNCRSIRDNGLHYVLL